MSPLSIPLSPNAAAVPDRDGRALAPGGQWHDLVALAMELTGCAMALMSLSDPALPGAGVGLSPSQAPLVDDLAAFASAPSEAEGALTIMDAAADERLASHPLVRGAPFIRFYASVCIATAAGDVVGSLAVLDPSPRVLSPAQARCLHALARQAANLGAAAVRAARAETLAQSLSLECERLTSAAQRRRKEDGELLELVLRGGDLGLWDLDVPSGHWSVNAREYAMLGYAPDDIKPATLDWKSLVHPDDWAAIWLSLRSHLEGASAFCEAEHRLRHREGHWIWVLNRCVAVERDATGRAVRVVGTHMDVTARKHEEDARRQAGDRLALALSGGDIGLWDLDVRTGRATYNEQWWRMFGYVPDELETVDGLWQSMVHPDDYADAREGLARHVNGESPMYEGEVRVRHKDGHWLWIQNRAKVVERDANGAALRIVGINLNITQSKHNRLALKRTTDLLQRTSALARVGGWEIDSSTGTMQWSDEVYRIHDLDRSWTPSIRKALKFYAPEAQPALVCAIKRVMAGGPGWDLELTLTTASGRQVWVRSLGQGVLGEGDAAARLVGTIQDITELKQARERLLDEQRRLQLITDNLPASVTHVDRLERLTFANRYSHRVFGEKPANMLGRTLREVQGNELYAPLAGYVRAALRGETVAFESEIGAAGQTSYLQTNLVPDFTAGGDVQGFFAMTFDVTERKLAELKSAASERRLRGLTDNVPVLITELDLHERVVFCNGTHEAWFGTPAAAVMHRPIRQTITDAHYALRKPFLDRAFSGETVSFEQAMSLPQGERVLQTIYLPQKDSAGHVLSLYCLTNDVTELKQKQLQLDALARKDTLTGLPNRRSFEERVHEAMARTRRSGDPIGVMYLDLDRFKGINDSLGHAAGDAVLLEFAQRLSLCVRETDLAARYAGDEFVILLEGMTSYLDAQDVASKILLSMRAPFTVPGTVIAVTTSIGFAMYHGDDEDLKSLLARADTALYAAKNEGRNRLAIASVSEEAAG